MFNRHTRVFNISAESSIIGEENETSLRKISTAVIQKPGFYFISVNPIYMAAPHINNAEILLKILIKRPDLSISPVIRPATASPANQIQETRIQASAKAIFSDPLY